MIKKLSEFNSIDSVLREKWYFFEGQIDSVARRLGSLLKPGYNGDELVFLDMPEETISISYIWNNRHELSEIMPNEMLNLFRTLLSKRCLWMEARIDHQWDDGLGITFSAKSLFLADKKSISYQKTEAKLIEILEKTIQSRIYLGHSYLDVKTDSGYGLEEISDLISQSEGFSCFPIAEDGKIAKIRINWNAPFYPKIEEE